jgi:hypothetical protein
LDGWRVVLAARRPYEDIFAQRLSSAGLPLGGEFGVNTLTDGSQITAGVATDAAGNFVVVWRGYGAFGIFGRRYANTGAPLGGQFTIAGGGWELRPAVAADAAGTSSSSGKTMIMAVPAALPANAMTVLGRQSAVSSR